MNKKPDFVNVDSNIYLYADDAKLLRYIYPLFKMVYFYRMADKWFIKLNVKCILW